MQHFLRTRVSCTELLMKRLIFLLAVAVVGLAPTARAQTEAEITYQDFYDGLAPYGDLALRGWLRLLLAARGRGGLATIH